MSFLPCWQYYQDKFWEECGQVIKINKSLSLLFQYVAFSDNSRSSFVFPLSPHFYYTHTTLVSLLFFSSFLFHLPTLMSFISFSFYAFSVSSWKMFLLAFHSLSHFSFPSPISEFSTSYSPGTKKLPRFQS